MSKIEAKMDWYLKVLKNYVGFRGRARRKEYWMFILVNIIFTFVLGLLDKMLGWQRAGGEGILTTIYGILVFLPWWAVQFRPCTTPTARRGGHCCS
ncbi:hypothetical protein ECW26_14550 [Escherichia coli W26]|nr:hypothetical protein ECW26_14550 [Escherichia coli W26]